MSALPLFSFGVIADIQYADAEVGCNFAGTRTRYYRHSLRVLREALQLWARAPRRPDFVLQLGDIIDGLNAQQQQSGSSSSSSSSSSSHSALDTVLREFHLSPAGKEVFHVWGNHELYNFSREELMVSELNSTLHVDMPLGEPRPLGDICAYSFRPHPGFLMVVLDAYDLSLLGVKDSSLRYQRALRLLQQHNSNADLNCPPTPTEADCFLQRYTKFNGGFSQEQLDWLDSLLTAADDEQEKVTIVSHVPVHPASTEPVCLAWNHAAVLSLLRSHPCVVLFMAGHDHDGGYHQDGGVHHLTLEGVVESPPGSVAFGTVSVFRDRMELEGQGRTASRVLRFD